MPRTPGAKGIVKLSKRNFIATSASLDIRHLAESTGSPFERFKTQLTHQENFLNWLFERHEALVELYRENAILKKLPTKKGPHGPKAATFRKYRWYAEQVVLLEAINSFEVFFKRTFIALGEILQELIPMERVKGEVDAKVLWSLTDDVSIPSLVFERQLFHDLDNIDKACAMLVDKRFYNQNSPAPAMRDRVRCMRTVFQIRHTLSHNASVITASDAAKFQTFGFSASLDEVIDPTREDLATAVMRFMREEAALFTDWLREATIEFLTHASTARGLTVAMDKRSKLRGILGGTNSNWNAVAWS